MRVALLPRAPALFPFERPPDACGLGAETFASYRERTLKRLGLSRPEPIAEDDVIEGPCLLLSDEAWVTRRTLRGFLQKARRRTSTSRLCLPPSRQLELFLPLQDVPVARDGRAAFDVAFVPAGARLKAGEALSLDEEAWLAPPYREILVEIPLPRHLLGRSEGARFTFPLTSSSAMRVRHWVHVLRANHLMPQVLLLERADDGKLGAALRALFSLRLTKASTLRALKARFVYRGRRTFVHPTACVEASILGDDVHIGAYAYVVGSVLGDGVVVEQRAHVEQSCLGPRTFVSKNSTVSACAAFGDTDVCVNGIQTCAIAERCGLTSWARPLDVSPGGQVRVLDGAKLREVGELPCGVAFGESVFVGAEVTIAPGRAIPKGTRLVTDPERILRRIDPDGEGALGTVRKGALEKL